MLKSRQGGDIALKSPSVACAAHVGFLSARHRPRDAGTASPALSRSEQSARSLLERQRNPLAAGCIKATPVSSCLCGEAAPCAGAGRLASGSAGAPGGEAAGRARSSVGCADAWGPAARACWP